MHSSPPHHIDCDGHTDGHAGSIVTERNHYFTGKLLVTRDLVQEQSYFLGRHRLHNRLLHGWGVVCGLEVEWHSDRENCGDVVIVWPGIAIDCEGRELVLCEPTTVRVPRPEPDAAQAAQRAGQTAPEEDEPPEQVFVFLSYAERKVEALPRLYDECGGGSGATEANRIRETAHVSARPARLDPDCWPGAARGSRPCRPCDGTARDTGCLEAWCPCGCDVPIALLVPAADPRPDPDIEGRRRLAAPGVTTRIVHTSWEHGAVMTIEDLAKCEGQLRVEFDRQLWRPPKAADGGEERHEARGINRFTFVVEYESPQTRTVEFVRSRHGPPHLDEDGCTAVFTLPQSFWHGEDTIRNAIVYVTLKCDFIVDCNGNPVDGDFLRGLLPTGDGTWGGTFESWFRLR